jgi:hypothetical protein
VIEIYVACLPVKVLGNDDNAQPVGRITALFVGWQLRHSRAKQQHHQIRILLNGTTFPKIR